MPTPEIFTSIINSYLPEPEAGLLNGIIFGISLKTSKVFYEQIKAVGLLHLVVLSGMNITIISSMIAAGTDFLGRRWSTLITILVIIFFIIFVGPQAPVIRAGFMGVLTLVAILYGRADIALYLLALSAIFIGIFWPKWLSTISFQLSYGATLGIILFGQVKMKHTKNWKDKLKYEVWKELKVTLAAQIFTVPIIFLYFRQLSVIAPLSNLLVSIFIGPLMVLGFFTAILGKINYFFGLIPALLSYGILTYIVFVVETLAKLPFVFFQF